MNNPFSIENKNILVTGASSNIGKSIAVKSSELGANLVINGRNEKRLEETLCQLDPYRTNKSIGFDISDIERIPEFVKQLPVLDGVVLCAAIFDTTIIKHIKPQRVEEMFRTNTISNIVLVQQLFKQKKIQQGGSVVFVSSVASKKPYIAQSLYSSTKGAINAFAKILALEVGNMKIRVNTVLPGIVQRDTGIKEGVLSVEEVNNEIGRFPLGMGYPEDVANSVVFLLSDGARWITGVDFVVDGGQSLT